MKYAVLVIAVISIFTFFTAAIAQTPAPATASSIHIETTTPHPKIHKALTDLASAKETLETAMHDSGGHRGKALDHVNAAIAELNEIIQDNKK